MGDLERGNEGKSETIVNWSGTGIFVLTKSGEVYFFNQQGGLFCLPSVKSGGEAVVVTGAEATCLLDIIRKASREKMRSLVNRPSSLN